MNEEQYRQFLNDVAGRVMELVANNRPCATSCFRNNCDRFWTMKADYEEAIVKAIEAARADPKLRDRNDLVPPKEGWEWTIWTSERDLVGFWSEPLPFSPNDWTLEHYGPTVSPVVEFLLKDQKAKEPTNINDEIMCDYVVLGLIHDKLSKASEIKRLCSINDETFRDDIWKMLQLSDVVARKQGEEIKLRLENALVYVKADLDSLRPEEADSQQGKFGFHPKKPRE